MSATPHKDANAALPALDVVLVAFDGVEPIDLAGPASVFSKAEALRPGRYRLHLASPDGGPVRSNAGLCLAVDGALSHAPTPPDTVIVAGGDAAGVRAAIHARLAPDWLAGVAPRTRRVASVCTGAFVLAAAGLLDGREATTHWAACEQLQVLYPRVQVRRECIYVRDGPVWTSAGVTTGIELALALVEDDFGREVSMDIARALALPLLRDGGQAQLSPMLQAQAAASRRLRDLPAWIATHLQDDLSVAALAQRVSMSPRHFARSFAAEIGCTPARYVAQQRLQAAEQLLRRTQWPQERIAGHCGYGSVDALQRAFVRRHGVPPQAWRRRSGP